MLINLKASATEGKLEHVCLELTKRLPKHISTPCALDCQFKVNEFDNYYLISLELNGDLLIQCQRCLKEFNYAYHNKTQLAVCYSDTIAEQMMSDYECVVSDKNQISLDDLVTDELHLYAPQMHLDFENCDQEMEQFLHPNRQ